MKNVRLLISLLFLPQAAFAQADAQYVELDFQFEQGGNPCLRLVAKSEAASPEDQ